MVDMHTKDDRSGPSTKPRRFPVDENSDTAIIVGLALLANTVTIDSEPGILAATVFRNRAQEGRKGRG